MQIHQLPHKLKVKKRIGRGGKRGNYSGKGIKGQRSRAGRKIRPALRELILRLPKRRGFKFKSLRPAPMTVNLSGIEKKFDPGEKITILTLQEKKLIHLPKSLSKKIKVKILGLGQLTKTLTFSSELLFSHKTKAKILNSGSKIETTKI